MRGDVQPSDLEILAIHDDIVKAEEYREPEFDHRVVDERDLRAWCWRARYRLVQRAVGAGEHGRNDTSKHLHGLQANLLVLADLAEVGDADGEVREGAESDDSSKVILVDASDKVEGVAGDSLC